MTKIVHPLDGDQATPIVDTTDPAAMDDATAVKTTVGIGQPYLAFETLDPAIEGGLTAVDWTDAPICSNDTAENRAALDAMLADPPLGKLTYA